MEAEAGVMFVTTMSLERQFGNIQMKFVGDSIVQPDLSNPVENILKKS